MSEAALAALCPAKVNLSLRVLGRRTDGYHEIETWFQTVDLWDRLEATPSNRLTLTCDDSSVPTDDSNLVLCAASRLREAAHWRASGAALHLRKRIPVGGGLGGGSSDAAGTLLLLSRMWDLGLEMRDLEGVACGLGADVPFFLHGGTALGTGRGDRIERLPFLGSIHILLAIPPFGISTAEVYGRLQARLTPPSNGVRFGRLSAHKWPGENDFGSAVNDLQEVVFTGWPAVASLCDAMQREGARPALLSGSGSTVFGIFEDGAALGRARESLGVRFPEWTLLPTRAIQKAAHVVSPDEARGD